MRAGREPLPAPVAEALLALSQARGRYRAEQAEARGRTAGLG